MVAQSWSGVFFVALWGIFERDEKGYHTSPTILTKLWTALANIWLVIPVKLFQKLVESMSHRVAVVIKVDYEPINHDHDKRLVILTLALCGGVAGILLAAITAYLVKRHSRSRDKLQNITQPDTEASQDYQDLCRQRMASKANEKPEPVHSVNSPKKIRSLSQEGQASSSSHSSTSSWYVTLFNSMENV
ncbi:reverse transcriptase domain-containing protein [Trichonephila clavipes]|uniref:Reverse transcriptase domain-containing protein n=1 Tax=Trichonephila clavipes TaxID=2585209 RepID=A0A8X6S8M3_TRICX|nr:reverse transcriptase domain-containing protein [Trichonephila clavipes]